MPFQRHSAPENVRSNFIDRMAACETITGQAETDSDATPAIILACLVGLYFIIRTLY